MANQIKTALIIFFLSLFIYLLGNGSHGLWDRDEPRYAVATRHMVSTGDWIIPHFNDQIRYDKPILIYWMMALPMKISGMTDAGARFNSGLMGAFRNVAIFYLALAVGCRKRGAIVATVISAVSPLLLILSKASIIDSTLSLFVVLSMLLFWLQEQRGFDWKRHIFFWALVALMGLVKGPPGPAVVFMGILAYKGWNLISAPAEKDPFLPESSPHGNAPNVLIRLATGFVVFLIVGMPWVLLAWQYNNGEFFKVSFGTHVVERSQTQMEGHGGPIVYYIPIVIAVSFPFIGFLFEAIGWSRGFLKTRSMRFLWSWIVPGFIMFSVVQTKLPHYIAPLMPAFFAIIGLWWEKGHRGISPQPRWWRGVVAALVMIMGIGLFFVLPLGSSIMKTGVPFIALALPTAIIALGSFIGSMYWMKGAVIPSFITLLAGWLLGLVTIFSYSISEVDAVRPSKPVGYWVRENVPPDATMMMAEYDEPTLVFYTDRVLETMSRRNPEKAMEALNDTSKPAAFIATAYRWSEYMRKWEGKEIHPQVRMLYKKDFFHFETGTPLTMVVIGNWPNDWKDKNGDSE